MNTGAVGDMLTDKDENGDYKIPRIIYADVFMVFLQKRPFKGWITFARMVAGGGRYTNFLASILP